VSGWEGSRTRGAAGRLCDDIRTAFVGQDVLRCAYEQLITDMPESDPDDHVHAAVATARAPTTIVTENAHDFPGNPLAAPGVRVCRPEECLGEVIDVDRPHGDEALDEWVERLLRMTHSFAEDFGSPARTRSDPRR